MYDSCKIKPLHIMHSKASAYVKDYNEKTNWVYFLIKDDELLNKCSTIWDKISDTKIELNDIPVHNKNFLKTGTKFYVDEATDFLEKKFFAIALYSIFGVYGKYYPHVFLNECK